MDDNTQKTYKSIKYSNEKPVMTDDTSYYICFSNYNIAYVAMLLLNLQKVQSFLTSIAFHDAKRPYTKKVLERIDFERIVACLTINNPKGTERDLNLAYYVINAMYDDFKNLLKVGQMRFA